MNEKKNTVDKILSYPRQSQRVRADADDKDPAHSKCVYGFSVQVHHVTWSELRPQILAWRKNFSGWF